jgi:hypothetical protein
MCVQADSVNSYNLHVGRCSGVTGIVWQNVSNGDGSHYFINVHFAGRHMAGDNFNSDPMIAAPLGLSGWFYKMQPLS